MVEELENRMEYFGGSKKRRMVYPFRIKENDEISWWD